MTDSTYSHLRVIFLVSAPNKGTDIDIPRVLCFQIMMTGYEKSPRHFCLELRGSWLALVTGQNPYCGSGAGDADAGGASDRLHLERLSLCADREAGQNCQCNYRADYQFFHGLTFPRSL